MFCSVYLKLGIKEEGISSLMFKKRKSASDLCFLFGAVLGLILKLVKGSRPLASPLCLRAVLYSWFCIAWALIYKRRRYNNFRHSIPSTQK